MTLSEQIRALPSIKDEHGDECVSRQAVLGVVAGAEPVAKGDRLLVPRLWRIERCTKHSGYEVGCLRCEGEILTTKTQCAYEAGLRAGLAHRP